MIKKIIIFGLSILFAVTYGFSQEKNEQKEREILIELFNALDGDSWKNNDNWNTTAPLNKWYGITVKDNHVVRIDLKGNNLSGELPKSIKKLKRLHSVDFSRNNIIKNERLAPFFANFQDNSTKTEIVKSSVKELPKMIRSIAQRASSGDCPPPHVALVVDESGSISGSEPQEIRDGLQAFVDGEVGSGLILSLIGMSNQDTDVRTDHILEQEITTITKPTFDTWITEYKNRTGPGISAQSDYWASGLDVVINDLSAAPNIVIVITDGSQVNSFTTLQQRVTTVNNISHMFVYGVAVSNSYVDNPSGFTDLATSLEELLGTPPLISNGVDDLLDTDYDPLSTFVALGTTLANLSTILDESNVGCECEDCYSFMPKPGESYIISGWVKEDHTTPVMTYQNTFIRLTFLDEAGNTVQAQSFQPIGNIIDGWQRITDEFMIPSNAVNIEVELRNDNSSIVSYFDDIRVHPYNSNMKSFVYDPQTQWLMAELDENNYATYYEYDNEGGLVRVKKETEKGVYTIQETRSSNTKKAN